MFQKKIPHYSKWKWTSLWFRDNDKHCCILHNFLLNLDNDESLIDEVDRELIEEQVETNAAQFCEDDYKIGCDFRDDLTKQMWLDYENS